MNAGIVIICSLVWESGRDMDAFLGVTKYIELWLSERGLKPHEINRGMELLLGDDWRQMSYFELFDRIRARGSAVSDKMPMFADELEALVRGALKLEEIYKTVGQN